MKYTLVKLYPGSLELGTVVEKGYVGYVPKGHAQSLGSWFIPFNRVENFPEFWEKESSFYFYIRCSISSQPKSDWFEIFHGQIEKRETIKCIEYLFTKSPIFFVKYLHGCALYVSTSYPLPEILSESVKFDTLTSSQEAVLKDWFFSQFKIAPTYNGSLLIDSCFKEWKTSFDGDEVNDEVRYTKFDSYWEEQGYQEVEKDVLSKEIILLKSTLDE